MAHFVKKKKVARTNKKALIGFICLIRAQFGGKIKGIQNVRYSILQKNYNPKSSVSVTLQYDKIMNIIVWICC